MQIKSFFLLKLFKIMTFHKFPVTNYFCCLSVEIIKMCKPRLKIYKTDVWQMRSEGVFLPEEVFYRKEFIYRKEFFTGRSFFYRKEFFYRKDFFLPEGVYLPEGIFFFGDCTLFVPVFLGRFRHDITVRPKDDKITVHRQGNYEISHWDDNQQRTRSFITMMTRKWRDITFG